jgi:hypothetical protein
MPAGRRAASLAAVLLACATAAAAAPDPADGPHAVVGFVGPMTDASWPAIVTRADQTSLVDQAVVGVGLARRLWRSDFGLEVEIEGQLAGHFGDQSYWEVAAPLTARWTRFPWSDRLRTGAAFGLGLSYAGAKPEVEIEKEGRTERLLAYWLIELEAGPPRSPWSGLMRIHHRSVAFGTFGDEGGSNALVFGMRRRF